MSAPLAAPDYTRCPCCSRPLAEHRWSVWHSSKIPGVRGVVFYCEPEGKGGGSGAEGNAA